MNRRLQEAEARRALEMAEDEGRAHIDELLTATQGGSPDRARS